MSGFKMALVPIGGSPSELLLFFLTRPLSHARELGLSDSLSISPSFQQYLLPRTSNTGRSCGVFNFLELGEKTV